MILKIISSPNAVCFSVLLGFLFSIYINLESLTSTEPIKFSWPIVLRESERDQ
jgi:hypothetical protein